MRICHTGPLFTAAEIRWHKDFKETLIKGGFVQTLRSNHLKCRISMVKSSRPGRECRKGGEQSFDCGSE